MKRLNKYSKIVLLGVLLFLLKSNLYAQKRDSLILIKADSISKVLNEAYLKNDWYDIGKKEFLAGAFFQKNNLYKAAIEHFENSEKAFQKAHNTQGLLSVYKKLGNIFYHSHYGENSKALNYYLKAYELADSLDDSNTSYVMLGNIGSIYSLENRYDEGLKYLFEAIDLLKSLESGKYLAVFYGNIANVYVLKNDYDSAYYYYDISNKVCIEYDDTNALARNYVNLANLSLRDKKYDKAINYLKRSLKIYIPKNNDFGIAISYKLMAKAFLLKKEYFKAETYANESLEIGRKIGSSNRVMSAYKLLWKINEEKQNYKQALMYLNLYKSINDSIEQQKENDEITLLISDFETQQNLHEIKLLRTENSLKKSQLENRNVQLVFIIIIAVGILLSGILFVWLFLKKKTAYMEILRKNVELEEQETCKNEILEDRKELMDSADMILIDAWQEKIIKAGLFKNSNCTIDYCVQELKTNRSYLSRAINHFYGKNFNSVINELRVKDARKLLRQKEARKYTIEYIAQEVGFNNKVSFSSSFKKITGLTPAFYRDNVPLIDDLPSLEE